MSGIAGYTSLSDCVQAGLALLIAANTLVLIAFSTTGWATYSKIAVETGGYGIWKRWTCKNTHVFGLKCTDSMVARELWTTAFQSLLTLGLIAYMLSLILLLAYGCHNRCKANKRVICAAMTLAVFGGSVVLCGILTFAVKMWPSLSGVGFYSYSFFFAIISVLAIMIGMIPLEYERKMTSSVQQQTKRSSDNTRL